MNCDECAHDFKPLFHCIGIREVRQALLAAISQTVWVVWRGCRYPIASFYKVNYSWCLWAEKRSSQMTLANMVTQLEARKNWEGLHNYSLRVRLSEPDVWASVIRVEDTRTMPTLEDETEAEDITGEVLIYVHTKADVQLAWEASH